MQSATKALKYPISAFHYGKKTVVLVGEKADVSRSLVFDDAGQRVAIERVGRYLLLKRRVERFRVVKSGTEYTLSTILADTTAVNNAKLAHRE
jgi:hypothetical protein